MLPCSGTLATPERGARPEAGERLGGDGTADSVGDDERRVDVCVREEDGELVAAGAGSHIADALVRPEAARNQLEQRIALLVATEVVHRLQPVAVADDHRHRHLVARRPPQLLVEALVEAAAVESPVSWSVTAPLLTAESRRDVDQRGGVLREEGRCLEVILRRSSACKPP